MKNSNMQLDYGSSTSVGRISSIMGVGGGAGGKFCISSGGGGWPGGWLVLRLHAI